MKTVGRS